MRAAIDGQQRLTTVQLLVRGILDVLLELKSARIPRVRRLIQNPVDVIRNPSITRSPGSVLILHLNCAS